MDINNSNEINLLENYSFKKSLIKEFSKTIYAIMIIIIIILIYTSTKNLLFLRKVSYYDKVLNNEFNYEKLIKLKEYEKEISNMEKEKMREKEISLILKEYIMDFKYEEASIRKSLLKGMSIDYLYVDNEKILIEGKSLTRIDIVKFIDKYFYNTGRKLILENLKTEDEIYLYSISFQNKMGANYEENN